MKPRQYNRSYSRWSFLWFSFILFGVACQTVENIGYMEWDAFSEDTGSNAATEDETENDSVADNSTDSGSDHGQSTDTDSDHGQSTDTDSDHGQSTDADSDHGQSTDADSDHGQSTDTDSSSDFSEMVTRVPFHVSVPPDDDDRILAADNSLGLSGAWYDFNDVVGSNNTLYYDNEWNSCSRGEVGEFIPGSTGWTFAGIGVGLCYDPVQNTSCYTLPYCPYISYIDFEIVGVSFEMISNTAADLKLEFYHQATRTSSYIPIPKDGKNREYLFTDATSSNSNDTMDWSNISNIQILVDNADVPVSFDYCVRDFSLLVK